MACGGGGGDADVEGMSAAQGGGPDHPGHESLAAEVGMAMAWEYWPSMKIAGGGGNGEP